MSKNHKVFTTNNKVILKTQQRFKSEKHITFTEEINKTAQRSLNDEIYAYGTSKDLVSKKVEIKCSNIIKQASMMLQTKT